MRWNCVGFKKKKLFSLQTSHVCRKRMEKLVITDDELSTVISANMLTFLILHSFVHLIYSDSLVYPSKQTFLQSSNFSQVVCCLHYYIKPWQNYLFYIERFYFFYQMNLKKCMWTIAN